MGVQLNAHTVVSTQAWMKEEKKVDMIVHDNPVVKRREREVVRDLL